MDSKRKISGILIFYSLLLTIYFSLPIISWAEIVDRIVATVDDDVITLSELKERSRLRPEAQPEGIEKIDEKEVLEGMINRILLLSEAKRLGIVDFEEDSNLVIERFIERKIKAFILIPLDSAKDFYEKNKEEFKGKEFSEVRDEINLYLKEEETNRRLKSYLMELKKKADIRQLFPSIP